MIPLEIITMGVSFAARAIQQHFAYKQQNDAAERAMTLKIAGIKTKARQETQKLFNGNGLFGWTCSILAILAFLAIVVLPKVVPLFDPTIMIHYGFTEDNPESSILFGLIQLSTAHMETTFHVAKGILITPVDSHLLASIAGLFFGGINIKRRH